MFPGLPLWTWGNLVRQRYTPMVQIFVAVLSSTMIIRRNGGLGAWPYKICLELYSPQCRKIPLCKLGDLISIKISCHSIYDWSILFRKKNNTLPNDQNPSVHLKGFILYTSSPEIFYCISETQAKVL